MDLNMAWFKLCKQNIGEGPNQNSYTAQKIMFSFKDFFCKCKVIIERGQLRKDIVSVNKTVFLRGFDYIYERIPQRKTSLAMLTTSLS